MFWCFFFKQKTAYEMSISDWSSYVCSSDLGFWVELGLLQYVHHLMHNKLYSICDHQSCFWTIAFLFSSGWGWLRWIQTAFALVPSEVRRQIGRASCRERVCQYV